MMLRPLVTATAFAVLAISSCMVSDPPPPTPAERVFGVSPESLWRTPEVWKDRSVVCLLAAESYRADHSFLLWYDGKPGAMPAVVFECSEPLPGNLSAVEVIGTCRGRVDGRVLVADCTVKIIRQRLP